jgi:hypothetical protein
VGKFDLGYAPCLVAVSSDGRAAHRRRTLLDLISMPIEFSEPFVLTALALGIIVAIGLIIREKVQGGEQGISR